MSTRVTLRIDFDGERRLGPGKIALLEAIQRKGSIAAAGREFGMAYRRAWLLVDALNHMFSPPVVETRGGGKDGGGGALKPAMVSNSLLAVCSQIRRGGWASIVPHTFFTLFGKTPDLIMIDLVQPIHSQAIGLVLSNRDPLSPMASAVVASVLGTDFGEEFALMARG